MKKVMVFGTFDLFHPGHKYFLTEAKRCGDYLMVVVARDETVKRVKNKLPLNDENIRKAEIEKSGLADEVKLGSLGDKYAVIEEFKPDVICLGYDQKFFIDKLEKKLEEFGLETVMKKLKPYKEDIYKSSIIAKKS